MVVAKDNITLSKFRLRRWISFLKYHASAEVCVKSLEFTLYPQKEQMQNLTLKNLNQIADAFIAA